MSQPVNDVEVITLYSEDGRSISLVINVLAGPPLTVEEFASTLTYYARTIKKRDQESVN